MTKKRKSRPAAAPAPRPSEAAPPPPPASFQGAPGAEAMPAHDEIARRAYELFVKRGGRGGDPIKDWLDAEAQLKAERKKRAAARG